MILMLDKTLNQVKFQLRRLILKATLIKQRAKIKSDYILLMLKVNLAEVNIDTFSSPQGTCQL